MLNDRVKQFLRDIEKNQYSVDAWGLVVRELQGRRIEEVRPIYENAVAVFPTAGKFWKLYIDHELRGRNYDAAEMLFQRCLMRVLNLELWRGYLAYVRDTKHDLPSYNEKMAQAYDFALEKIGCDVNAYNVWNDYIVFLDSVNAIGRNAELQKITAIRNIFHKGLVVPMLNIESLWSNYVAYEERVNLSDSAKLLTNVSERYNATKVVSQELETVMRGLNRGALSVPPTGAPAEITQVELWKRYLKWEKSNPLKLDLKTEFKLYKHRVMFAFDQALLCMSHHADLWIEGAEFLEQALVDAEERGDDVMARAYHEELVSFYMKAIKGHMRKHPLVNFAFADFYERRQEFKKAANIYDGLVSVPDCDPTIAYVQYMAFARRTEGGKAARAVFRKARENPKCRYHAFIAAALTEYLCSKDKNVAFKIFELGLKKYSSIPEYVLSYVDYLSHLNEDNNIRVLFERVLSSCSIHPEKLLEIWDRYLEFEANHGDLASIMKVEKRRALIVARMCRNFEGKESLLTIDRYKFADLLPLARGQLLALGYYDLSQSCLRKQEDDVLRALKKRRDMDEVVEDDDAMTTPHALAGNALTAIKWKNLPADPYNGDYMFPDVRQMLPFQPRLRWYQGKLAVPGGEFPTPMYSASMMRLLPPPTAFRGPFVHLESLKEFLVTVKIPGHGKEPKQEKNEAQNKVMINGVLVRQGDKDPEDGSLTKKPDVVDVYTRRQKLRVLRGRGFPMATNPSVATPTVTL